MAKKHLHEFEQHLLSNWPIERWQNERILIAVSGGADSVALFRALVATSPNAEMLSVGHFNHKLRSTESDIDERFVRELADRHKVSVHVESMTATQLERARKGEGIESAARTLRYDFLTRTANSIGARYLTTAHTRDDVVETVIHNIVRGTGISGLAGIRKYRRISEALTLVRPLLPFPKSEVVEYLNCLRQSNRFDESNDSDSFTRNRIRNRLLPILESEYSSRVRESIARLAKVAADTEWVVNEYVSQIVDSTIEVFPNYVQLDLRTTNKLSDPTRREVFLHLWRDREWPLQQMSHQHWHRLSEFSANNQDGRMTLPGEIIAFKENNRLKIGKGI